MQLNLWCFILGVLVCGLRPATVQADEAMVSIERQLAQLDAKLTQLFVLSSEQIEAVSAEIFRLKESVGDLVWRVEQIQRSVQQVANGNELLVRDASKLVSQSDQVLLNQQYCANHEALKEMFFEWTAKCSASGVPNVTTPTASPNTTTPSDIIYDSCREAPARSGVYRISYNGTHDAEVFCQQEMHGGAWMVFQSRQDGSVDFNRSWNNFKYGFGTPYGEFWLGLDILHQLTVSRGQSELLILLQSDFGLQAFELYPSFGVDSESTYYRLLLPTSGSGNATDSLFMYRGERFVTHDSGSGSRYGLCLQTLGSSFWHYDCSSYGNRNNLNGLYGKGYRQGIWWAGFGTQSNGTVTRVQMMIRIPETQSSTTRSFPSTTGY